MDRIILASESPRRKEILSTMGISFDAIASNIEEKVEETLPTKMVQALAMLKTSDIVNKHSEVEDAIFLGADTMIFHKGKALGKPKDEIDAYSMLEALQNDTHEVMTGVAIIIKKNGIVQDKLNFSVCTEVTVLPLTREQIMDYIHSGEPMDKAGAYAIQGRFGIYIKEIAGDYYNVMGLPIARIYEELLKKEIDIKKLK